MTSRDIRSSFLAYFERNGHRRVPSSPLVPADDPSLLFTNAGMNQFKDVFLGRERRDYTRAVTVQKCMRVSGKHNDLDNVGPSLRHHTFFEMLGNFSFGDYFKKEAIAFAWDVLTEVWQIPSARLHATVFGGEGDVPADDEAFEEWRRVLPAARVSRLGLADNFWSMGDTGPCGRCSEIHYFHGGDLPCAAERSGGDCRGVACDCDRFVEIWNNVFMEFDRRADGTLAPLPAPSIDTGMGLERIAAVLQGTLSNYDTDLFTPLLNAAGALAGTRYGGDLAADESMRVIADHLRATAFLIADGVMPSNEWRGYVLRKIMRRAMRHGRRLGLREPFLFRLVDELAAAMGPAYPEIVAGRDAILAVVRSEEERFGAVLEAGLPRLEDVIERVAAGGGRVIPGDEVFRLYDSLGLPVDFIEDLAGERRLALDRDGFDRAMETQRNRARAGSAFDTKKMPAFTFASEAAREELVSRPDLFEGYSSTVVTGEPVVALFDERRCQVERLDEGASGWIVLRRTPFYVEAGGQVSDAGWIRAEAAGAEATVLGVARLGPGGIRAHQVRVDLGAFETRAIVTAEVDAAARDATRRHHTGTHLLHAALRAVLGPHVTQAGSLVAPDRLRFDFVHFSPVGRDELDRIERLVNEQIWRNVEVVTEIKAPQEAIAAGAMALFGEKYGDRVRVVSIPDFSVELCGGTHCRATGEIGLVAIVEESGVAAGVRRIEAVAGAAALEHHGRLRGSLAAIVSALGTPAGQAVQAIERLQAETRRLSRELTDAKTRLAVGGSRGAGPADDVEEIAGVRLIARRLSGLDKTALRGAADSLKDRLGSGVVVLASDNEGKVAIVVSVSKDLAGRVHAGRVVGEIAPVVGGGGGGRPDFAEAGGRSAERIDEMLARSRDVVRAMLGE